MKKTLSLILAILLLSAVFFVQSCNKDTGDISGDTTDADSKADVQPEEANKSEKDAIKSEVLALAEEDSREDPTHILKNFLGDYIIPDASLTLSGTEHVNVKQRIYSKNGICAIEYENGIVGYTVTKKGYMVNVSKEGTKNPTVTDIQPLNKVVPSSIFYDAGGIDISSIYTEESDTTEVEEPELTSEMLTVSDDLTTCTFSEEYLVEVAKSLIAEMSLTSSDTEKFMQSFVGKGKYDVKEKSVSFSLSGETELYGKISISLYQKENEEEGLYYSVKMKIEQKDEDGSTVVITNELTASNVRYNGDKVISAKLSSTLGQLVVTSSSTVSTNTFTEIDASFGNPSREDGFIASQDTIYGTGELYNKRVTMQLVGGKISVKLISNNEESMLFEGENVAFQVPDDVDIPEERIMKAVNSAINKYEAGQ